MKDKSEATEQKLRGGYYTPSEIARFILRWGTRVDNEDAYLFFKDANNASYRSILEPSCGDGVFLKELRNGEFPYRLVHAIEINPEEAEKAKKIPLERKVVDTADFHEKWELYIRILDNDFRYDLIVGNPPFIRYQYYSEEQKGIAKKIYEKAGLKFSNLSNAWATFVVGCTQLLTENGRLGFVLPSDLLQVSYAEDIRKYLAREFNSITLISFRDVVFNGIQQDTVIFLGEKNNSGKHTIYHFEIEDLNVLETIDVKNLSSKGSKVDFNADKWTRYFLTEEENEFIDKVISKRYNVVRSFADVEIGLTTGANDFFTVDRETVWKNNLEPYAWPVVRRSSQMEGIVYDAKDWGNNIEKGDKCELLLFRNENTPYANMYIAQGEEQGINKRYKTRIRDNWYVLPYKMPSTVLFTRRSDVYPKFVYNKELAYNLDSIHSVILKSGYLENAFVASYFNSISFAFTELAGRSYGGGVLELLPSEIESVFLPYREKNKDLFDAIDKMVREKKPIEKILDYTDKEILGGDFTEEEIKMARNIWRKLVLRRRKGKKF